MRIVIAHIILATLLLPQILFSQIEKGDKFISNGQYEKAIKMYQKALKKSPDDLHSMNKIANAFSKQLEFERAEEYFFKAFNHPNKGFAELENYVKSLCYLRKFETAKTILQIEANKNSIGDISGLINRVDSLEYLIKKRKLFLLRNVREINSSKSENSVSSVNDRLMFASNRTSGNPRDQGFSFYRGFYSNFSVNNKLILDLSDFKETGSNFSGAFHYGASSFSEKFNKLYFTKATAVKSKETKQFKLENAIYESSYSNAKWSKDVLSSISNPEASCSDPSIHKNGDKLLFASDMEGGAGGYDIYIIKQNNEDGSWSSPEAFTELNTIYTERYPFFYNDTVLYFCSDRPGGFGALDIYVAIKQSKEWVVNVMRPPINSSYDDFGIYLDELKTYGFMVSNRPGGKGGDDIYYLYKDLDMECKSLHDDYCVTLTATNDDVDPDIEFSWVFGVEDNRIGNRVKHCFPGPGRYYLQLIARSISTGAVVYHEKQIEVNISEDNKSKGLITINAEHDISFQRLVKFDASGFIDGCSIVKYIWNMGDGTEKSGKNIEHLYAEAGEYQVSLTMLGEMSNCVDACDTCVYKLITISEDNRSLEIEVIDTSIWVKGKILEKASGEPIFGVMVTAESDMHADFGISDEQGIYYIPVWPNQVYKITTITDEYLNLVKDIDPQKDRKGQSVWRDFELEKVNIDQSYEVDNIYYDKGKFIVTTEIARALDKLYDVLNANLNLVIEVGSHTDARSTSEFNQQLSEKRASEIVKYLSKKGIDKKRLRAKGYGESQLFNHCADGIVCSDLEHAQNRRTEFKVLEIIH